MKKMKTWRMVAMTLEDDRRIVLPQFTVPLGVYVHGAHGAQAWFLVPIDEPDKAQP